MYPTKSVESKFCQMVATNFVNKKIPNLIFNNVSKLMADIQNLLI